MGGYSVLIQKSDSFNIVIIIIVILFCQLTLANVVNLHSSAHKEFIRFVTLAYLFLASSILLVLTSYLGSKGSHESLRIQLATLSRWIAALNVAVAMRWLRRPKEKKRFVFACAALVMTTASTLVSLVIAASTTAPRWQNALLASYEHSIMVGLAYAFYRQRALGRGIYISLVGAQFIGLISDLWFAIAATPIRSAAFASFMHLLLHCLLVLTSVVVLCREAPCQTMLDSQWSIEIERRTLIEKMVAAQDKERERIARDLHDDVGQMLTRIVSLSSQPGTDLRELTKLAQSTLDALRQLIFDLRPPVLDDLGLIPAVRVYFERFLLEHQLEGTLRVLGDENTRYPPEIENNLYRVIVEGLTNVARHSQATKVGLLVETHGSTLKVIIEDNGIGFDPVAMAGFGIKGMAERINLIRGTMAIESSPGHGTAIHLRIPLESRLSTDQTVGG